MVKRYSINCRTCGERITLKTVGNDYTRWQAFDYGTTTSHIHFSKKGKKPKAQEEPNEIKEAIKKARIKDKSKKIKSKETEDLNNLQKLLDKEKHLFEKGDIEEKFDKNLETLLKKEEKLFSNEKKETLSFEKIYEEKRQEVKKEKIAKTPKLTNDQMRFLKKEKIPLNKVFNASGLARPYYLSQMKELDMIVAIGVTPCQSKGHTMRTSSGHCVQCNPHALDFRKKYKEQLAKIEAKEEIDTKYRYKKPKAANKKEINTHYRYKNITENIAKSIKAKSSTAYAKKIEKIKAKNIRAYSPWKKSEENKLKKLFNKNNSITEISWALQRQKGAIKSRLGKLNLIENYNDISDTFRKAEILKKSSKKFESTSNKIKVNKNKVRASKSFVNATKAQQKSSESKTLIFPAIFLGILLFTFIIFNQESGNLREIQPAPDSAPQFDENLNYKKNTNTTTETDTLSIPRWSSLSDNNFKNIEWFWKINKERQMYVFTFKNSNNCNLRINKILLWFSGEVKKKPHDVIVNKLISKNSELTFYLPIIDRTSSNASFDANIQNC